MGVDLDFGRSPPLVEAEEALGAVALEAVDVVGPVADVGPVVEEEPWGAEFPHGLPVVAVVEDVAVGGVGHVGIAGRASDAVPDHVWRRWASVTQWGGTVIL